MIKIYDINDNVLIQAELTSAAVREEELSKSDYIQLSFSTTEKLILPVGAYIEHTYKIDKVREITEKFLLLEAYEPTQMSESSWKYTPNFQHPKMILSKTPFYILTKNSKDKQVKQSVWSFVGATSSLSEKISDFLNNDIKFGKCGWVCNMVGVTANTINVSFSDNDFISALSAICNAIGDNCEWHIDYDNEQIYIGKVVIGSEPVVLEVGKNIGSPSVNSSRESYYNSFSVFGGSRNITQVNSKGENISSGDIRLQLSAGTGSILIDGKQQTFTIDEFSTIDLRKDKKKEPLFTKILDFSDIFPSLNTYAYNVRGRVKYVLDENNKKIPLTYNSDGSVKEYKTFTVWYMRLAYPTTEKVSEKTLINTTIDDGVTHYWYDFEITDDLLINGKNIGCSFEANFNEGALSTPLAGRGTNSDYVGFELTYHDKDELSKTSDDVSDDGFQIENGDYEIIYQEDNNIIIPSNADSMLIPRGEDKPSLKCNITVLYNIAMKESVYENDAKSRLLEAAKIEIIRLLSDLNNYSFKSYPQIFASENPCLQIGQSVTYKDGNGYTLESRVLKLSTNIDYDFVQEITIGNQTIKGTTTQLRENVQKIIASGGSNGGGTYTAAQMNNLIAKYGTNHFLSKKFNDTAQGFIEFLKGLKSDELTHLLKGATFGNGGYTFDKNGNIVINSAQSLDFDDALQKGFGLTRNSLGKYELSLTNLFVWGKAVFNELEIRKLSSVGGNVVLSAASSKIVHVEEYSNVDTGVIGWKCYLLADDGTTATTNGWRKFDQARCQQFNIKEGTYHNVSNRDYWRAVVDVSTEAETIYGSREVVGEDETVTIEKYDLYDGKKFDWIVLSATNCRKGDNDAPMAGDTIVLDGHQQFADDSPNAIYNDSDRTNLIMLETTGAVGVPRIVALTNIVDFEHDDDFENGKGNNVVFVLSPTKVIFVTKFFEFRSASGDSVTLINNKGAWVEGTKYYYYDQVVYENAYWTCIAKGDKEPTTEKPSLDSDVWRKDLEIGEAVKVENTETLYAIGDGAENPTQPSDDKFIYNDINEALADIEIGDFLWSKTIVTYSDGHETVTYGVSRLGDDGAQGKPGANGMTTHFAYAEGIVFGSDGKATGVSGQFSTTLFNGAQYIGTYTDNNTTDSTDFKKYDWTKLKGERGDKGDKGDQGDKGDDAVVYSVVMSYASMYISSVLTYGIRIYFRKTVGDSWDNLTITSDKANGYCKVYVDGSQNAYLASYINSGNSFIDYSAYSDIIKSNSKIRVDWYDKDDALLAIGNYSVAGGSVIAYCNSDSKPSKPTASDINNLSGGWSLTPKSGGTTTKFSNVSFGNYSVGATKTGYTTSEWSEVTDGGYVWRKSPAGLSDSYGWALMKVSFTTNIDNVDIEVRIKGYSEVSSSGSPWDTIQVYGLDEEVSFSTGTSYAKGGVAYAGGNGVENSNVYNVSKAGQHFIYVAYAKDSSNNDNGDYGLFRIASQATVSLSSVVWMSKADVKDGRVQLPWSDPVKVTGEDGEKGEDAVSIVVEDAPLIFDTDDNGLVPTNVSKSAKVKVLKGVTNVTANVTSISSQDGLSVNAKSSVSLVTDDGEAYIKVTVRGSYITNDYIDSSDTSKGKVSASSGYANISFVYDRKAYHAQVPFQVNVSKFTGSMIATNKKFQTSYSELTNNGTITSLTDYKSEILQTAREISLSVSEKAAGRRNMLPGSALRKKGEGVHLEGNGYISLYDNYLETNSLVGSSSAKDTYIGLRWRGGLDSQCVHVKKGHKYTLSCWAKSDSTSIPFTIEAIWQASASDNTRPAGYAGPGNNGSGYQLSVAMDKINTWQLMTTTFEIPNDASYEYLEIFLFFRSNDDSKYYVAMSRPMMEESDEYSGVWSMSEKDFDYIGGNLLDNTATFANGDDDNVNYVNKVIENGYENRYNVAYAKNGTENTYTEIAMWGTQGGKLSLTNGTDYVFSFLAKGIGRIVCYMYKDGTPSIYTDNKETNGRYISDGSIGFNLEPTWRRYYVHWRVASTNLPTDVLVRATDITEAWIAKPKLEVGCTMTDWTEKRTDMVDKQALLDTGINITDKKITITADNTIVQDNSGKRIALLNSNNGYINTSLLNVEHIYLKNQSSTVYGHFGFSDADGGTYQNKRYPLWVGAANVKDAPFSVSEDGYVYATKGKIGPLGMDEIGLYIHPLDINGILRKGADFRSGGFWISQDNNDCNNELMVGNRCWYDPLNANKKNYYTTTTLGSSEVSNASVIIAKRWNSDSSGDSRINPAAAALMVESKGVGISSFALNFLGGMAAGCIRASSITGNTLTAMHLNRISMVVMTNSSAYTFPLPKTPVEGQMLVVVQGNGQIWFDTAGKTIYCGGTIRNNTNKFDSNTVGQFNIFLFDGYYWQLQFIREKA